ncbi:MAG: hypothetical protein D6760_02715 [Deltaproteobacteria bacterium]|nr:MAG: hypothetical protein D6760_02715 [Deltaproteobacteria bacterium]
MPRQSLKSVEECYRGANVRVFRLDRSGIIERLRKRARTLVTSDPTVIEVRLFGSLARGEGSPGSDADLFVLLDDSACAAFLERIPPLLRHFAGVGIGCDMIAYTRSEYAAAAERGDRLIRELEHDAVVLVSAERAAADRRD